MVSDHYTYRVTWSPEDGQHVRFVAEFHSLSWLVGSQIGALTGIRRVVDDVVRDLRTAGESAATPFADRRFTGEFKLRVPPQLHRMLVIRAAEENVSLNRLINSELVMT